MTLFVVVKAFSTIQTVTGDEPRYVYAGWSFFKFGSIRLDEFRFIEWAKKYDFATPPAESLIGVHSVLHSKILSPIIYLGGPQGGRWCAVLLGLVGAFFLHKKLRIRFGGKSIAVIFVGYFSIPMLCYMSSLYAEIWLGTFVAISWTLISDSKIKLPGLLFATSIILWMPLFHLRALPVSIALFLILLSRLRGFGIRRKNLAIWIIHTVTSCAITVVNLDIHSSTSVVTPSVGVVPFQLLAQLFSYRHGLLIFAPVYLLAFLGLLVGLTKRERLALEALVLLISGAAAFIWGSSSESDPARFWVIVVPPLLVGLGFWLEEPKNLYSVLAQMPLMIWTACNSILYIIKPYVFLANRTESQSIDILWERFRGFGMPFVSHLIPGDDYESPGFHENNFHKMLSLSGFFCAVALILLTLHFSKSFSLKRAVFFGGTLLLVAVLAAVPLEKIPSQAVSTRWLGDGVGNSILEINLEGDHCPRVVAIKPVGVWWPPSFPHEVLVSYFDRVNQSWHKRYVRGSWNLETDIPCGTKVFFLNIPRIETIDFSIIESKRIIGFLGN